MPDFNFAGPSVGPSNLPQYAAGISQGYRDLQASHAAMAQAASEAVGKVVDAHVEKKKNEKIQALFDAVQDDKAYSEQKYRLLDFHPLKGHFDAHGMDVGRQKAIGELESQGWSREMAESHVSNLLSERTGYIANPEHGSKMRGVFGELVGLGVPMETLRTFVDTHSSDRFPSLTDFTEDAARQAIAMTTPPDKDPIFMFRETQGAEADKDRAFRADQAQKDRFFDFGMGSLDRELRRDEGMAGRRHAESMAATRHEYDKEMLELESAAASGMAMSKAETDRLAELRERKINWAVADMLVQEMALETPTAMSESRLGALSPAADVAMASMGSAPGTQEAVRRVFETDIQTAVWPGLQDLRNRLQEETTWESDQIDAFIDGFLVRHETDVTTATGKRTFFGESTRDIAERADEFVERTLSPLGASGVSGSGEPSPTEMTTERLAESITAARPSAHVPAAGNVLALMDTEALEAEMEAAGITRFTGTGIENALSRMKLTVDSSGDPHVLTDNPGDKAAQVFDRFVKSHPEAREVVVMHLIAPGKTWTNAELRNTYSILKSRGVIDQKLREIALTDVNSPDPGASPEPAAPVGAPAPVTGWQDAFGLTDQ